MSEDEFKLTDAVLGQMNPNPDRVGCPPIAVLAELAGRRRPIEDTGYDHLAECSPCYLRFREFQKELTRQRTLRLWLAIAATILLVIGVTFWWTNTRGTGSGNKIVALARPPVIASGVVLDLRPLAVKRSDNPNSDQATPSLSRTAQQIMIVLPVGAEDGPYEFKLLDFSLKSALARTVNANTSVDDPPTARAPKG